MSHASTRQLPGAARIALVFANLLLGLAPSLAFFVWVERNASLPRIGLELGWPWTSLQTWPTAALSLWNAGLFLAFGAIHSLFAQSSLQARLARALPNQTLRTFYVILTGLSLLALMGLWQNTGVVLWIAPLDYTLLQTLSISLFAIPLLAASFILRRFDPLEFVGLRQIYGSNATPPRSTFPLFTQGVYGITRHPIYTLMLISFVATPFMTLDRAIVFATTLLYLGIAVPVEERKLVARFGEAYETYRLRVPAIVPFPSKFLKPK